MTDLTKRLDALTNAQLAAVYNQAAERPVTKFADHATAVKRTQMALEAKELDFLVGDDGTITVAAAGSPEVAKGDDRVITVLVEENPKGAFGASHRRFALYKTGMTVGEYVKGVMALGHERRVAIRDLAWDTGHGYIKVG